MPLNKYVSHITHICPTVLPLRSTYRPYINAHLSPKKIQLLITMLLPYMCQQEICPSSAILTQTSFKFSINRFLLTCWQAFANHTECLHQVWGKMLLSAILYVLDGSSDVWCICCCCYFWWFLVFSPGLLNRTPSHMWGRLYLSMFQ